MSKATQDKKNNFLKNFRNSEQYQIVKRVFRDNFAEYRNRYILAIILMVIASAATGASAWMMREVINSILKADDYDGILLVGLAVIAIFMTKGFATYGHTVTLAMVGNALTASVQKKVFTHLLSLRVEYFDSTTLGEIFIRANGGVVAVSKIIEKFIMSACRDVLTLFFLGLVMIIQEPLISLSVLAIGPLAEGFKRSITRRTRVQAKNQLRDLATSQSLLKETISGITMIKTYSLENEMSGRMNKVVEVLKVRKDRIAKLGARTSPIMETLGGVVMGVLVIYSGWWITTYGTEGIDPDYPGKLMSFITAFLLAYAPAKKLAKLRVSLEKLFVEARFMYDLLDEQKPEVDLFESKEFVSSPKGNVEIKDVNFSYDSTLPILHNISLSGKSGEKIGLVGPSGSGKSTIFKLILALYKPTNGTVKIDGQDVFGATPEHVRGLISYVGQEAFVYTGSVLENIAFGKLNATKEEIIKAAKLANADNFISKMKDGYDTFVGESGAQLSGGQRQRIAIARAFLKDAPIVLLDEATSSLDTESEQAIQSSLDELVEGKTTFIIAHRLSTVQKCDKIYVVSNGSIVEQGSHMTLINDDKIYAQLFKMQFRA